MDSFENTEEKQKSLLELLIAMTNCRGTTNSHDFMKACYERGYITTSKEYAYFTNTMEANEMIEMAQFSPSIEYKVTEKGHEYLKPKSKASPNPFLVNGLATYEKLCKEFEKLPQKDQDILKRLRCGKEIQETHEYGLAEKYQEYLKVKGCAMVFRKAIDFEEVFSFEDMMDNPPFESLEDEKYYWKMKALMERFENQQEQENKKVEEKYQRKVTSARKMCISNNEHGKKFLCITIGQNKEHLTMKLDIPLDEVLAVINE